MQNGTLENTYWQRQWQGIILYFRHLRRNLFSAGKWIAFSLIVGILVGGLSALFALGIGKVTAWRLAHSWMLFGLPIAGMIIVYFYEKFGDSIEGGTNLVLTSIRERKEIPGRMAPMIFGATLLTHAFGGSAGREGAALQLGGSLGSKVGEALHLDRDDVRRAIMCGMSASFSALFGTPLAATVLPLGMTTVGAMYYSALVPCSIASIAAYFVAEMLGVPPEQYSIPVMPDLVPGLLRAALLALLCAVVSSFFCWMMHMTEHQFRKWLPNPYLRVLAGSGMILLMTYLAGSQEFNGTGNGVIHALLTDPETHLIPWAFFIKIVFTAVTLGSGFKGGEIVPSLFIGASFGALYAQWIGGYPPFYAAIGMACLFCGVTNTPISALLISFELFGFGNMPFFLIAVSLTYLFSGNYGLYRAQRIRYGKFDISQKDSRIH